VYNWWIPALEPGLLPRLNQSSICAVGCGQFGGLRRCCRARLVLGCDLDTLAGVPGFKRMSMEVLGDDLLTTFLARRI
jgi:hypothetical protein